jgi:hypothetical protein
MENQNPQQEPIAPDYQFITDQQSPDVTRKPHAKKVYVLFGLLFALVVIGAGGLLFGEYSKKSPESFSPAISEQTSQRFIDHIKAGQYQQAGAILPKVEGRDNTTTLQELFTVLDPQSCVIDGTKQDSPIVNYVTVKCDRNDKAYNMTIQLEFVEENGNNTVRQYFAQVQKN